MAQSLVNPIATAGEIWLKGCGIGRSHDTTPLKQREQVGLAHGIWCGGLQAHVLGETELQKVLEVVGACSPPLEKGHRQRRDGGG